MDSSLVFQYILIIAIVLFAGYSLFKIIKKNFASQKFKKGKPVKVKVKLLDSNGKAWKKRKIYAYFDGSEAKNSSKCRSKLETKTDSKGYATFTICPQSAGTISYSFGWWDREASDWYQGFAKGSTSVKKKK